jgi:predicted metal-binding membrane protein
VPLSSGQWFVVPNFCGATASGWLAGGWRGLELSLLLNPPELLAVAWLLMLLAMMPPLLAQPIRHLWDRSLRRRRKRAVALFVAAYAAVWTLAGLVLLVAAILLRALAEARLLPSLALAIAIALLWQATPAKQTCLNRCHRLPRLSAFGLAADLDCLRYGLVAARWCVATCWALMLVPLLADGVHVLLMAVVSVLLLAERQTPARPARWSLALPKLASVCIMEACSSLLLACRSSRSLARDDRDDRLFSGSAQTSATGGTGRRS